MRKMAKQEHITVRPKTHKRIKLLAAESGTSMVNFVELLLDLTEPEKLKPRFTEIVKDFLENEFGDFLTINHPEGDRTIDDLQTMGEEFIIDVKEATERLVDNLL